VHVGVFNLTDQDVPANPLTPLCGTAAPPHVRHCGKFNF